MESFGWLRNIFFSFLVPATFFISALCLWRNCRRIFVMVLKGLSTSKLRELVVQPNSETTQSFQLSQRMGQSMWTKFSCQALKSKLLHKAGRVTFAFAIDIRFNPTQTTSPGPSTSERRALVIVNYGKKDGCNHFLHQADQH